MFWNSGTVVLTGTVKSQRVEILHPVDAVGEVGRDIMRAVQKLDAMRADMISVNPVLASIYGNCNWPKLS